MIRLISPVPQINSLLDLTVVLKTQVPIINEILRNVKNEYNCFSIYKRNGKKRNIFAPNPLLKDIQKNILTKILDKCRISRYAYGFKKNYSIIDNARMHIGSKKLVKMDIKDFFPSIRHNRILRIFMEIGYSRNISLYLTKLCCLDNKLPQGAPTSPALSNIFFKDIDNEIIGFSICRNIIYTRYADDLAFSGNIHPHSIFDKISNILQRYKLKVNQKKCVLRRPYQQQKVTGIIVNEKLNTQKKYRKKIRQEMYYIKKFGLRAHCQNINNKILRKKYLMGLYGRINFVLRVNPNLQEFSEYKQYLLSLYDLNHYDLLRVG